MGRPNHKKNILTGIIVFLIVFALAFFGIQFITKTGIFRIPGVVYYSESLKESEISLLNTIFTEEIDLDKDVTISAANYLEKPSTEEGQYLYSIYVPTTDFYSPDTNVVAEEPDSLFTDAHANFTMTNIDDLDFTKKLLSINDEYFLNSFDAGAVFRVITFESEKFEDEIKPLVEESFTKSFPTKDSVLTLAQTGVTALSRGMNAKLSEVGNKGEFFAENIGNYLSSFDLTHTSNEASFTNYANSGNICSKPAFINTLIGIGLDIVELTGNHNLDCGDTAALETMDIYEQNNIKTVGGGRSAEEAAIPLEISDKGTNITMLAYNLSTGGSTYDATPGANQYYEENAVEEINKAKERGDIVIVDIQYYECNAYASTYEDATCDFPSNTPGDEVGFFRHLIDLGADIVVGTSAHQPQTYELYGDGEIYYGLGNLFFDQFWWPGTTRSLVLEHYFYNGKILQTRITPTVYNSNMQTTLLDEETSKWLLQRLVKARP